MKSRLTAYLMAVGWLVLPAAFLPQSVNAAPTPSAFVEYVAEYAVPDLGVEATVALDLEHDRAFVADPYQSAIYAFSATTHRFDLFKLNFAINLFNPQSICIDHAHNIWIANPFAQQVLCIDPHGALLQNVSGFLAKPVAVACAGQHVVLFDQEKQGLFYLTAGALKSSQPRSLSLGNRISSVKLAAFFNGDVCVLDAEAQRFYMLSADPKTAAASFAAPGDATVRNICRGPSDSLFTCTTTPPGIQTLSRTGRQIQRFVLAEPYLEYPVAIAWGQNEIWVADAGHHCVLRFRLRRAVSGIEHAVLGEEYLVCGHAGRANTEFQKAFEWGYQSFDMHLAWGQALYAQDHFQQALTQFEHAEQYQPQDPAVLLWRARTQNELGAIDTAIHSYRRFLELNGRHADATYELGLIYLQQNQLDPAQALFERSLAIQPNFNSAHLALGRVHLEKQEYALAQAQFESLLESDSRRLKNRARFYLGLAALQNQDFSTAVAQLRRSVETGPFFSDAFYALGCAYQGLDDKKNARWSFRKALEIDPEHQQAKAVLQQMR